MSLSIIAELLKNALVLRNVLKHFGNSTYILRFLVYLTNSTKLPCH